MSKNTTPTWMFALVAGVFWVVGAGFVALAQHEQQESRAFMSVARKATGTLVRYVIWTEKERGFSSRTSKRPVPEVEFETETGQKARFIALSQGDFAFKSLRAAKPGTQYPVLYDPGNPSRAQLDAGLENIYRDIYAIALFCAVLALVLTILWLRRLLARA